MGRLIDADNLNFEGQNYNKSQMKAILDFVDAQPTAYDENAIIAYGTECYKKGREEWIEKVVTGLDNAESVKVFGSLNSGNRLIPVSDAIDIVRKGGVNENKHR